MVDDLIKRRYAIDAIENITWYHQNANKDMICGANSEEHQAWYKVEDVYKALNCIPTAQPEIIRCKDCEHWRQQTNYQGVPLSFGLCESDDMWRSLYGEIYEVAHIDTDDDFYCGYAERKTDE